MKDLGSDIIEQLGWYVYRLIDPRNGETFYVGKGKGNRILQHLKGNIDNCEDKSDLKRVRIREIQHAGLEVGLIIHRHNLHDEATAYAVEAAVIDAYPGLNNRVGGHYSDIFGCRHLREIIAAYKRPEIVVDEPTLLISIGRSFDSAEKDDVYHAVRGVWKISEQKAKKYALVLAHIQGIVAGAFRPTRWLPATQQNFSWLKGDIVGRIGFEGIEAEPEVREKYINKRVPQAFRQKGAANPIRYIDLEH
ncbi:LEM-3-like GIY-YIG domain-containing protein [Pelagibacterium lentulum]|uniref:GIY-YIG domain-containing protein n=1 Tax=Pelagibacterium lentulum TaxID=2029865 RepID=A0A916VW27_9HYPH|nr:hypothetical protein [Pelagibacterium lentulum]GGA42570.1 hypothetical protein GCM10011499_10140 [Pelagibacterium lentulum]